MPEVSLKLFFSYSHKDETLRDELAKHLTILERQSVIFGLGTKIAKHYKEAADIATRYRQTDNYIALVANPRTELWLSKFL